MLEYDIRGLFDKIDHALLAKALRHHCDEKWILLLVERWLTAPMHGVEGTHGSRTVGTPQGGPLSPILGDLLLHYVLDRWLVTHHPSIAFRRYADDGILHCTSEGEAKRMREYLDARLRECGLELHPEKTRVVYCKDSNGKGSYENVQFDFLGYTFRPRLAQSRIGKRFTAFSPAMSRLAAKAIQQRVRRGSRRVLREAEGEIPSAYSPLFSSLTLLGVSKPVTLTITSMNCGPNPFSKKETCGFDATGSIKRTDFGVTYGAPAIGEVVDLQIGFEALKN